MTTIHALIHWDHEFSLIVSFGGISGFKLFFHLFFIFDISIFIQFAFGVVFPNVEDIPNNGFFDNFTD